MNWAIFGVYVLGFVIGIAVGYLVAGDDKEGR